MPETVGNSAERSRRTWDEMDLSLARSVAWLSLDSIARQVHRFPPTGGIISYVEQLLLQSAGDRAQQLKGAAVVCGDMESERGLFEEVGAIRFTEVDGFDLSPKSLERVRPTPFAFHPHLCDCNDLVLERDKYDLVVVAHGMHHIFNVGGLMFQINKSLRPGGVLFLHEWIGPERLQIPIFNHLVSTLLLFTMFGRKQRTSHDGIVKGRFVQYGPETFDPSEACNSMEIRPQLLKYFDVKSCLGYGGVCYPMFEGLGKNFDEKRWFDAMRIGSAVAVERLLTKAHLIQPLFLAAIAMKREVW